MNILIIGGGKMGMSHLAVASRYVGRSSLALCDSKLSVRILFRLLGYRTFSSVKKANKRLGRIDGALIATPTSSHAPLVQWAIAQNIPAFVEKPLTLNVQRSEELVRLAEKSAVEVQVGFVMRYISTFRRLHGLICSEQLGRVEHYSASMRGNVITKPLGSDSWIGDFARGGGCLNEYGPHIIDLCRFLFGPVASIDSVKTARVYCNRADDRTAVECTHESAVKGCIEVDWCDPTKRKCITEVRVALEYADVRADNSALEIRWREDAPVPREQREKLCAPELPHYVGFNLRGEEFSLEMETFLGRCLGRSFHVDPRPLDDMMAQLEDGYEVDRIIDDVARKAGLK